MKLSEKIIYYRKRAGMNQEALADRLGVSRQAVSKWETGEAVPELNKVVLLARVFGVTTDALLMDDAEEEPAAEEQSESAPVYTAQGNWVESVPGVIGRLLRRYGWLSGVYLALSGAGMAVIGALARGISNAMVRDFNNAAGSLLGEYNAPSYYWGDAELLDSVLGGLSGAQVYINGELVNTASSAAVSNPVAMLGGGMIAIGVIMMIGGAALAVVLKKKSGE